MARLLTLSDERIDAELRRIAQSDEDEHVWRRRVAGVVVLCGLWYGLGLFLGALSLHLSNGYHAQVALWSGLLIGNGLTLTTPTRFT